MPRATRLLLIRHGTTKANVAGCFLGQTDAALNDAGRREADALALRLADVESGALVASDLSRARDTALRVAQMHRPPMVVGIEPGLRELHMGDMELQSVADVWAAQPELAARWRTSPATTRMPGPGAETLEEVQARAWEVVERLRDHHRGETVALVSHTFVILALVCRVLDIDLDRFRRFWIDRASITEVRLGHRGPALASLNDIAHLV